MTEHLHPTNVADLALAPVAISLERNLARLREAKDLAFTLALELNDDDSFYHSAAERADRVQRCATRSVDLHGWTVSPTADLQGLAVSHGEFTISLMLGSQVAGYVAHGRAASIAPLPA